MNVLNVIKSVISYFFTFVAGIYFLCLVDGEADFFMVFGFVACLVVTVITSPLLGRFFKFGSKGK